jgi:hypothetical protein
MTYIICYWNGVSKHRACWRGDILACLPSSCFFSRIFRLVYIKFGIWLELSFSCIFVSHCYCLITKFTVQWKWVLYSKYCPRKKGIWAHSQNFEKHLLLLSYQSVCLSLSFSVRPSVRIKQLGSHWPDFHGVWYLTIFRKFVEKVQDSLKSDNNNGYCTWLCVYICTCTVYMYIYIVHIYCTWRYTILYRISLSSL